MKPAVAPLCLLSHPCPGRPDVPVVLGRAAPPLCKILSSRLCPFPAPSRPALPLAPFPSQLDPFPHPAGLGVDVTSFRKPP